MDSRDNCDWCRKQAELYHNETLGLSLCAECDQRVDQIREIERKHLANYLYNAFFKEIPRAR